MSLAELHDRRRAVVTTAGLRVRYLNTLRDVVGRRCERNAVGAPLVSDYDLLDATAEEISEALAKVESAL